MPDVMPGILIGVPQRFGGRQAIVPIKFEVFADGRRTEVTGYYPYWYREYIKFHILGETKPPYRTLAEIEGIEKPEPVKIRINRNCTIKVVG